jgi:hypothetical protein
MTIAPIKLSPFTKDKGTKKKWLMEKKGTYRDSAAIGSDHPISIQT